MPAVACQHRRTMDASENLREGYNRHVRHFPPLRLRQSRRPPNQKERFAAVLVRRSMEFLDEAMDDLGDLIHKCENLTLEHLRRDAEISDPRGADDAIYQCACDHDVDAGTVAALHIVTNDVRSRNPEAEGQKRTKLDDRLFKNDGFHGFLLLSRRGKALHATFRRTPFGAAGLHLLLEFFLVSKLLVGHLYGDKWILADCFQAVDHFLHRTQYKAIRVAGKVQRGDRQNDTDESREDNRVTRFVAHCLSNVEIKFEAPSLIQCHP
mmetsp:Transcript_58484/g.163086  ORF Transcript_58484/g.163086 Transcript_58484/m.163086 type:complete len:266 (+) Transcript_58484:833-1630(+)